MNKHLLLAKVKSTGTAYLFWLLLGAHYAYLGRWGLQILYWFTFGGLGLWAFIDLFTMSGKVNRYNAIIYAQVEEVEKKEKDDEQAKHIATIKAVSNKD